MLLLRDHSTGLVDSLEDIRTIGLILWVMRNGNLIAFLRACREEEGSRLFRKVVPSEFGISTYMFPSFQSF